MKARNPADVAAAARHVADHERQYYSAAWVRELVELLDKTREESFRAGEVWALKQAVGHLRGIHSAACSIVSALLAEKDGSHQ